MKQKNLDNPQAEVKTRIKKNKKYKPSQHRLCDHNQPTDSPTHQLTCTDFTNWAHAQQSTIILDTVLFLQY